MPHSNSVSNLAMLASSISQNTTQNYTCTAFTLKTVIEALENILEAWLFFVNTRFLVFLQEFFACLL